MTITNWEISKEEYDLAVQVADRALRELTDYPDDKHTLFMDLNACHANGCPLDFEGLLEAPLQDFSHDIAGIREHIDRSTGKLGDFFTPRYALANVTGAGTIDVTPRGLLTPEGAARVNKAADELQSATVMVANTAAEFIGEQRATLLEVARGARITDSECGALREALHQMDALISARQRKQDAFLAAVAGAPPEGE